MYANGRTGLTNAPKKVKPIKAVSLRKWFPMKKLPAIIFFSIFCFGACVFSSNREKSDSAEIKPVNNQNTSAEKPGSGNNQNQTDKKDTVSKTMEAADCFNVKVPGKELDKKQTFTFDYEPFKNACFVTAHDPEFDDPPLGSEFFIYRDGRQVFKFPKPFNGVTTGCWAEGVAFQDLNEDGLTDIIIAGMCSAKTAPYNENMIYVNRGNEFTTNEDANYTLVKFKKIKDIADFVKRNKEQFF